MAGHRRRSHRHRRSCFAQHVGPALRAGGFDLLDVEPPPPALPAEHHARFGYGLYSARHGNIYTARQLRQIAEQALGVRDPVRSSGA
ncbi:MAG: hypothetical protein R3F65_12570 [bacterium]